MQTKKLDIPFIKSRGFECGQACVAMMVKFFKPSFKPDFDQINKIIHHKKGMYTFPPQLAIILNKYGIKTKAFSSNPVKKSTEDPNQFKKWFGKDYKHEMKYVDIPSFDFMVDEMKKRNLFSIKKTKFEDLLNLFKNGYLVAMPIDWNTLSGKKGPYNGHFVIISGIDEEYIYVHNPDVGPFVKCKKELLKKAWEHPAIAQDFLVAYKKK